MAKWPRTRQRRPLTADVDPFYEPPDNLADARPGEILRTRSVKVAWFGVVTQPIQAWQVLYRTTDIDGKPEATITTVLLPAEAQPDPDRPLLAFQCAIDAIAPRCLPSYCLQKRAKVRGSVPPFELLFIANALRRGWAVTVCDHTGRRGRFGAPLEPGFRVLDGIRATRAFEPLGLGPDASIALMGYSGGGMASSWAVEVAADYAPELNLEGAVLGSPVGDPGNAFLRLNKSFHAGLPTIVVAAMRQVYPDVDEVIKDTVTPLGKKHLHYAATSSTISAVVRLAFKDFDNYVERPLAEVLAEPSIQKVFADMRLALQPARCPLLVVQSTHDQIINVADVDAQVERYREFGVPVEYVRDKLSEHISLMFLGLPTMLDWLDRRLGDEPPIDNTTDRSVIRGSGRGYAQMLATFGRLTFARPVMVQRRYRRVRPWRPGRKSA